MSRAKMPKFVLAEEVRRSEKSLDEYFSGPGKGFVITLEDDSGIPPMDFWLYICPKCGDKFLSEGKGEIRSCPKCKHGEATLFWPASKLNTRFVGSGFMDPQD